MWKWRSRSDEDFATEIQAHIAHEMKRLVEEEGLSFKDAKAQALRSFGNITHAQERFYERTLRRLSLSHCYLGLSLCVRHMYRLDVRHG